MENLKDYTVLIDFYSYLKQIQNIIWRHADGQCERQY